MKIVRIIISEAAIPSPGFGSWTQRMDYLFNEYHSGCFHFLLAEPSEAAFQSKFTQKLSCKNQQNRWFNKFFPEKRYNQYLQAIDKILPDYDAAIICVIDAVRLKNHISRHLDLSGQKQKVKLVYYQCGFSKYLSTVENEKFNQGLDHLIYLSKGAYLYDLQHYPAMPYSVSILGNPVPHNRFYVLSKTEKQKLREELGLGYEVQFVWASHDRPKKGLEIVLAAWSKFYSPEKNIALQVIGVSRDVAQAGVTFRGKIHSGEMHRWFQAADIGVFSSLWGEGFSLSLSEQISSGLFSIASTMGCVSDFFIPEKHGIAISEPQIVQHWVQAMEESLKQLPDFKQKQEANPAKELSFLTFDEWCTQFKGIFDEWEEQLRKQNAVL